MAAKFRHDPLWSEPAKLVFRKHQEAVNRDERCSLIVRRGGDEIVIAFGPNRDAVFEAFKEMVDECETERN